MIFAQCSECQRGENFRHASWFLLGMSKSDWNSNRREWTAVMAMTLSMQPALNLKSDWNSHEPRRDHWHPEEVEGCCSRRLSPSRHCQARHCHCDHRDEPPAEWSRDRGGRHEKQCHRDGDGEQRGAVSRSYWTLQVLLVHLTLAVPVPQIQEQSVAGEITSTTDEEELWLLRFLTVQATAREEWRRRRGCGLLVKAQATASGVDRRETGFFVTVWDPVLFDPARCAHLPGNDLRKLIGWAHLRVDHERPVPLSVSFLRTCPRGSLFHRVRGRRTADVDTGAQCAILSPVVTPPVASPLFSLKPRAFSARQGKTAVVTVVSDQTDHRIRQASSTSQTRRHGSCRLQPPSWPRRHRLPMGESTRSSALVCGAWFPGFPCRARAPDAQLLNLNCSGNNYSNFVSPRPDHQSQAPRQWQTEKRVCFKSFFQRKFLTIFIRLEPMAIGGELQTARKDTGVSTGGRAHSPFCFCSAEQHMCKFFFWRMLGLVLVRQPTVILRE